VHKLSEISPYFTERHDETSRIGLALLQKCTTALCQLAYGITVDTIDEYLKLGKLTVIERQEYYYEGIVEYYRAEFLRRPNVADTQRLLVKADERGFFDMLGTMHLKWYNCLVD
jgi:hypothetical protein